MLLKPLVLFIHTFRIKYQFFTFLFWHFLFLLVDNFIGILSRCSAWLRHLNLFLTKVFSFWFFWGCYFWIMSVSLWVCSKVNSLKLLLIGHLGHNFPIFFRQNNFCLTLFLHFSTKNFVIFLSHTEVALRFNLL